METNTNDNIMPKGMTKQQGNMGGQRRVTQSTCGWGCSGHPSEVNKKFERHKRYCNECKGMDIPKFNHIAANINGWRGTNVDGRADERVVTAVIDGVPLNFGIRGEKNIDSAFKRTGEIIRTTTSLCSNCHQLPVAPNRKCFDDWCERCDEALYSTKDREAIGAEPPLTKSQKKRQKQKAKKVMENEKKELLARCFLEKIPAEVLDKYLDDNEDKEDDEEALAELMGQYCSTLELEAIINMLEK